MDKVKLKWRRLIYKVKHDWLNFNNVLLILAVFFCFSWTWGSTSSMSRNWQLAETLAARQKELVLLKLEVETLEMENEYYASPEYQELAARRLQNKVKAGETLIYLPENSELARNKHDETTAIQAALAEEPSNFEKWMNFLFGAA